jgi:hypothetical protein
MQEILEELLELALKSKNSNEAKKRVLMTKIVDVIDVKDLLLFLNDSGQSYVEHEARKGERIITIKLSVEREK